MKFSSISKKLNKFKSSPFVSIVALLEVIILVCVSTFAWFVFAENNNANTDFISVEPDSGLDIDFNEANEQDYINIWNYLEEFQFEPVTSLDGRNIFVPTTGTFNSTDTSNIKFREATVNDMNSKYINIDFSLTNTGQEDMDVYLNSKSYFKFADSANGKALRLAFYQNDGSSGAISSSILSQQYDGDVPEGDGDGGSSGGDSTGTYTVYLNAISDWENDPTNVRAYCWDSNGKNNGSFPGVEMEYNPTTKLFSYTYDRAYNTIIFSYNGNQNQTVNLDVYDGATYVLEEGRSGTWALDNIQINGGTLVEDGDSSGSGDSGSGSDGDLSQEGQTTVYFNNTLGWEQPYAYIWQREGSKDTPLADWPGKPMTHLSGDIYYYTFNSKYNYIIFNDGNAEGGAVKTKDIAVQDGYIYMIAGTNDNGYGWTEEDYNGAVEGGTYPVISPGVSTGFQRPYAPVTQIDNNLGSPSVVIPAFASSIDDYNFGSKKLFTIPKGKTLSLSMIVWLEGTDPDCTEDVYSGKDIDMNLVFATSGTGGEKMYTYKFFDKTKENWIDDKITTDTGVSFNPVMQLYDADNQKGYLMKLLPDGYTWTVNAPEALVESEHIIFRRVNPMDENEVWNYWETHGFNNRDYFDDALVDTDSDGIKDTVYFTAFSDGVPTTSKKAASSTEDAGAPEYSCGGLWGNHDVQMITVYDGTEDQWIKNSDISKTTGLLAMNYTYNGQTVEYKASGPDKDCYYFIVPMNVYSNKNSRPDITFKRYFNFNTKYALNSDRNPDITYHRKWEAGMCNGKFFEINQSSANSKDFNNYWGYDMLYIQAKEIMRSSMDETFNQVHFYAQNSSNPDKYAYLHKNNNFSGGDNNYGYAAVIPSDIKYSGYRVERCNINNHDEKYNITRLHEIVQYDSHNVSNPNCVAQNICMIENYYLRVYLDCSKSYCGYNDDPECYVWDADGSNGNNGWPGAKMEYVQATSETGDSNYQQYYFDVDVSRYDHIIFNNNGNQTGDIAVGNVTGSECNVSGKIYEWDGSNRWRGTVKAGVPANETLNTILENSPDWP